MKRNRIEPLYRKVNTKARNVHHNFGGDAKYERHTKKGMSKSMHGTERRGLDYTPLFRFLLSKVGKPIDEVYSEAISRLDSSEPFWWMVAKDENEINEWGYFGVGESTYFSQLIIDKNGLLQISKPDVTNEKLYPSCWCCTHTLNGKVYSQKYKYERSPYYTPTI